MQDFTKQNHQSKEERKTSYFSCYNNSILDEDPPSETLAFLSALCFKDVKGKEPLASVIKS